MLPELVLKLITYSFTRCSAALLLPYYV